MSEVEKLREQVASQTAELKAQATQLHQLQARLDHLERHGNRLPRAPHTPRPNGELTSRLDGAFLRQQAKLQRRLVQIVGNEYMRLAHADNLRDSLPSNSADPATGQAFVDDVPRTVAAMLTREDQVRQELAGAERAHTLRGDNEGKVARLQVELTAVTSHTQMLLTSTRGSLPMVPQALHHAIAALGKTRNQSLLPAHMGRVTRV